MAAHLDEAEKQILGALLADFSDRALTADQLSSGYEGPQVSDLTAAICAGGDITQVDFDVAFSDLEKKELIKTGPFALYKNKPGSGVVFIGGYSKREYAGLTQLGYKTARQSPNRPSRVPRIVNNVHISGGQFSNLQLAAGNNVTQKMDSGSGVYGDILTKLVAILEKQGQVVSIDQRKDLASAIEEASEGNGKQAKSMLEKVCGPAWESVQPVMWPIVGELIKKSLGL
ncbi:hypothetical protein JYG35_20060 [Pseudomonas rhodesiae]|uniref:hypothetical protein n=1 Tax=Pseudomonas TaxID=286 RepID=UPI001BCEA78A|nr:MULTISPECIES: hypothetical protein [Pseudomonas]MBX4138988.1 hypothetical protein [Pseudomonas sp. S5F11]QVN05916.1 hypothetical protein JYG35_20060 [Pseudomonas rhodesiae]